MRIAKPWSFLLIFVALGCAKPRFTYDVNPVFRSASYKTVAPDPRKDRVIIREGMRPLNPEPHLRAALAELALRNYQPASTPEADLWVAVYVLVGAPGGGKGDSAGGAHREGSGEGHRGGGKGGKGTGGSPGGREGGARGTFTVIVQLEDRKTGLSLWYGEANFKHSDKAADGGPVTTEEAVHQLLQPLATRP